MLELMSRREARELGRSAWTRVRRFFYAIVSNRTTTTGLPSCFMQLMMCRVPDERPSQKAKSMSPACAIWCLTVCFHAQR